MKTIDTRQRTGNRRSGSEDTPLIDTSNMSEGQRAALEMTEAARDVLSDRGSFAGNLFMGRADFKRILPFPRQTPEDMDQGDAFIQRLESMLQAYADPDEIDETGEIPQDLIDRLAELGAFGIKIGREYGGLGLSQSNYCRAAMMLGGFCGNLTALLSAHQSIGVPQPLILFGTEEQKQRYLPRVARGEISAFALTEPGVGSDPSRMETRAEPAADGKHFTLTGEKLWCTNGTRAGVIVVMAKTPPKVVHGKPRDQVTAFLVETDWPGVEIVHRCRFMGLKALYNGVIRFKDVKVPRENIILAEGRGLKVALTTLNTGRLTLPGACAGLSKRCLEICRRWALDREQWGAPIGRHAAIADKLARMAAHTFAIEAMTLYTASLVDADKRADIRLEAAMSKLWGTEKSWDIVNDAMQIRGGRGYETAASLRQRGDEPAPVERLMRDSRVNTIFEGSSEIMRLFIAREALDPHLRVAAAALNRQLPWGVRMTTALKAGFFYAGWYPKQWLGGFRDLASDLTSRLSPDARARVDRRLLRHMRFVRKTSRRLARSLFHSMIRYGPALEKRQLLLGRLVDIGAELFALTAACSRAQSLLEGRNPEERSELFSLIDCLADGSKQRIDRAFRELNSPADSAGHRLAGSILENRFKWLEEGIAGSHEK